MTKKAYIPGAVALVFGLTLAVIGRYAGYGAELLRPEVLLGFGVVATLIALITLEYRVGSPRTVTQAGCSQCKHDFGKCTVRPAAPSPASKLWMRLNHTPEGESPQAS